MCHVIFIFLLYRHLVDKDRQQVNFLLPNIFRAFWGEGGWGGGTQSSAEAFLCLREARERKNESGWGGSGWEGEKHPAFSFLLSPTLRILFFNYCHFLLGYLACDSVEKRGDGIMMLVGLISLLWFKPQ